MKCTDIVDALELVCADNEPESVSLLTSKVVYGLKEMPQILSTTFNSVMDLIIFMKSWRSNLPFICVWLTLKYPHGIRATLHIFEENEILKAIFSFE